jgi:CRISPR system Cascade subunit CasD
VKSVLLRLEGPLQAWGNQSKLGIRATDREPTKSGVLGLVGAALGMPTTDRETLAELALLAMAVRVDREGVLLKDYHTAGGGRFRGRDDYFVHGTGDCVPSTRFYLQDASFVVALAGEPALVNRVATALRFPWWPLYLGRRSCPPSEPVFMELADGGAPDAVRRAASGSRANAGPRRLVVEAPPGSDAEPRYDVPLSFDEGDRRYGMRYVRTEWVEMAAVEPVGEEDARE